ncbi:secretin N-terminal domain-containing protein [Methylobacter sp.]|uniref:secretin N-terminal domain-containing protein n=1 Tax=Methylobacter sp. TaxID=2051955 RepID=UPI002489EFFC|nr:secretin N-terminal domain-containing protein [Methylobacter sp.]MDI1277001.1 secretin N-terminal domain-containing protein [Methylobacter sp.]MDI1357619.1 secretin N-terminal domain-containing protein [Methylobacter sp.]
MNNTHRAIAIALTLLLVACTSLQPTKSSNVANAFSGVAPQARSNTKTPTAITDALVPDFNQTLATSQNSMQQTRLNISVNEVDAREFFMGLVVDTEENMLVHPEVTGTISLELKNVTIAQVLDAVQKVYGYDYKKNDMGYIIYPATLQTKTFKIDRLDLQRIGNSNTTVSSGRQAGQNNSQGSSNQQGSSGQQGNTNQGGNPQGNSPTGNNTQSYSNSSSSSVRTITKTDFWQEMKESLTHIIAVDPQATVDINQQSGIVIVRAKPMQLREIESFLSATQTQISRQVILEAKILEVTLDDNHQDGVNWESIVKEGINKAPLLTGIGGVMAPNTFASVFTLGAHSGDFRAFVELMETQGKTNVLSSPRISTLNNQSAIIKVGQDEYFATGFNGGTPGATGVAPTAPTVLIDVFFSGISLDVTPQIDDNEDITLHIHPSISQVKKDTKDFGLNITLPLALTTVRESDSIVKAKNGQIIVLGGLMQENDNEKKQGVTGLAAIPYIGNLFRVNTGTTQKSELIILLKASFIGSDTDWQKDINSSKQRFERLDSQPRWK